MVWIDRRERRLGVGLESSVIAQTRGGRGVAAWLVLEDAMCLPQDREEAAADQ